jgi:hypothetical protein
LTRMHVHFVFSSLQYIHRRYIAQIRYTQSLHRKENFSSKILRLWALSIGLTTLLWKERYTCFAGTSYNSTGERGEQSRVITKEYPSNNHLEVSSLIFAIFTCYGRFQPPCFSTTITFIPSRSQNPASSAIIFSLALSVDKAAKNLWEAASSSNSINTTAA